VAEKSLRDLNFVVAVDIDFESDLGRITLRQRLLPCKLGRQINGRARFYSATLRFWFPPFKNNLNTLVAHAPGVGKLVLVMPVEQFPVGRAPGRARLCGALPAGLSAQLRHTRRLSFGLATPLPVITADVIAFRFTP
jgi:hypothetical protein